MGAGFSEVRADIFMSKELVFLFSAVISSSSFQLLLQFMMLLHQFCF